jgi:CRP/FNR family transcriptional regulator, anaerobic regulatory protein
MDDTGLRKLLELGGFRKWRKSEIVFRAGDRIGSFFKIRSGIVAVSRTLDDGRRQIVAVRAPGDCVGYLDNDGKYAFEGQALTDVEACAFDRARFDILAAGHPGLAAALAAALSSALNQAAQDMVVLGQLRSMERLAHFLAEIDRLYRERHVPTRPLPLNMSRAEIAAYLGLTIETVSRAMGKLRKRNIVGIAKGGEIVILDAPKLCEIGKVRAADSTISGSAG